MKAKDLIQLINDLCEPNDEIYITDSRGNHRMLWNPDITLETLDPTEQDESGGWRDINGDYIKGKPFHLV